MNVPRRVGCVFFYSFTWLFVCSPGSAQLPAECKAPAEILAAVRDPSAKVLDAAGVWFAQHKDYLCALSAFQKALSQNPGNPEAEYNLGLTHVALAHLPEAEEHFRRALEADPHFAAAHTSLGTLLLQTDRAAEAETHFRKVVESGEASVLALDNLGLALSAQRRYAAALRIWKQALAKEPESPEITLSVGAATFKNGDPEGGMALLKLLVASHPTFKDAHLTLANIQASSLLYEAAASEYGAVIRLDPADNEALLLYAKALSNAGSYELSRAPAEEYVRRKAEDPEGHEVLGSILRKLADYKTAQRQLALALDARPDDLQAQFEMGMALLRDEQPREAIPHLEKALTLAPDDAPTAVALASAFRRVGDTPRAEAVTHRMLDSKERERKATSQAVRGNEGNAYLQQGEPAKAVQIYREMLRADPRNARTAYNLALALAATHDLSGERGALEQAVALDPKMAVAESELGMMDLAAGKRDAAEAKLRAALDMDPQFSPARGNLGLVLALKGDSAGAEALFRQALQDDPKYVQGYLNLGLLLASRQDFKEAEAELESAARLAPREARIASALGRVEARLGKNDEAIQLFRKNIELVPGSAEARIELAIALADSFDLKGALEQAEVAARLSPQSAAVQLNRGRILFDLGRTTEARESLEESCKLSPRMPDPRYYLGLLEKQQGNTGLAAQLLHEVVELQPANVGAWYFYGVTVQPTDAPAAIDAWQRAARLAPDFTPALWSLTRALVTTDPARSKQYDSQLKQALSKAHDLDEAELTANSAIASMQAHDWPEALKGMKEAIRVCGECAAKASLHKSLGLAYCQSGDLEAGEKELRYAASKKAGDPDIERALFLIARSKVPHA